MKTHTNSGDIFSNKWYATKCVFISRYQLINGLSKI